MKAAQSVSKGIFVSFRTTEHQAAKLNSWIEQTGLSQSQVLRALIDAADAEPMQRVVSVISLGSAERHSEGAQR